MTYVMDLRNGEIVASYDLPAPESVRNAYLQLEQGNYNTWTYERADYHLWWGKVTVGCGDYCAYTDANLNAKLGMRHGI